MTHPLPNEKSERVKNLQIALNAFDANLEADGIYGPATKAALTQLLQGGPIIEPIAERTMSKSGIDFLILEEGIRLKPYRDSVGVPTIGVGSTFYEDGTPVKMTDPAITRERAISLFTNVRKEFEDAVNKFVKSNITQNQFDALVSLVYNIGIRAFQTSTVLREVNNDPNNPFIADAFKMWRNAGGKPILLPRRIREAKLYFTK